MDELHKLLESDDFDINTDLNLVRKKKQGDNQIFSTPFTLLDLDYNAEDVAERLKELKVEEYSETKIDKDDVNPLILFVFGKGINGKLIYVKLKLEISRNRWYVCHFIMQRIKWNFHMHND